MGGEERGVNIDGDNRVDCSLVVAYVVYWARLGWKGDGWKGGEKGGIVSYRQLIKMR